MYDYEDDEEVNVWGDEDAERQPIEWAPVYPTFRGFKGILGAVRAKKAFGQNLVRSRAAAAAAAELSQQQQNAEYEQGGYQDQQGEQSYQADQNYQSGDNYYQNQEGDTHNNYNEQYYDEPQHHR